MLKKNLLAMILTILLVACGQSTNGTAGPESSPTNVNKTETVTDSYDNQADDHTSDSDGSLVKNREVAGEYETSEQPGEKTANHALGDLEVHYIDAGQADAALFQYQDEDNSFTLLLIQVTGTKMM